MDTIFALATARGRAGVAVVRISGAAAISAAERLCGPLPESRGLRAVRAPDGTTIDQALVLVFRGTASFTGEATVELHLHGSPAVISRVLELLSDIDDLRLAEPGEFTRRALDNGKLDLAQVEGLADLIDAETEAQRIQAVKVFEGGLGELAERWRASLIRAAALIEATIDFADEEVPTDVGPEVAALLAETHGEILSQIDGSFIAERVRSGFEIAILGPPNVGKSTLLNRLAGRDAAITSDVAGTTRDVIEVQMDLKGIPVTFIDTAGIRAATDVVEKIGVEKALKRAEQADIRVLLFKNKDLIDFDLREDDIVLSPKIDQSNNKGSGISGKTGEGVPELLENIASRLEKKVSRAGLAIRERHRVAMTQCLEHLEQVLEASVHSLPADIFADELRRAIRSVDMIVGRVDVEDLLGEIFSSFCIGK